VAKSIEGRDGPDLSPDEIVAAVLGRGAPENLITLVGFLGDSDTRGHHRLFVDPALTRWLDIPDADIVQRHRIPREHDTYGGRSVLYVRRDAVLLKGEVTTADAEAEYLTGGDAGALHSEPDESLLVCRPLADAAASKTHLATLGGRWCC
jgi:hypothetical protein